MMTAAARPPSLLTERIAYQPETKSGSHKTRQWRKTDSNRRSRCEKDGRGDHCRLASDRYLTTPSSFQSGISLRQQPKEAFAQERDPWFESGSLHRRVHCEP